jgi:FtsP/CotA-like multicopper oxidase with cupredoxin domain
MSQRKRGALVAAFVVAAAVAFVIAKPGGGDDEAAGPAPGPAGETERRETETTRATPETPRFERIAVEGQARTIRVDKGETVRIAVSSKTPDEIHLHGYDITKQVAPGRPARFVFKARFEGVFEMEAHEVGDKRIASLVVRP